MTECAGMKRRPTLQTTKHAAQRAGDTRASVHRLGCADTDVRTDFLQLKTKTNTHGPAQPLPRHDQETPATAELKHNATNPCCTQQSVHRSTTLSELTAPQATRRC